MRYGIFQLTESGMEFLGEMEFPVPLSIGVRIDLSHRAEFADRTDKWFIVDRMTVYPISDTNAPILQEQAPIVFVRPIV